MEIQSWIENVEKAYETLGKELPLAIKSNLLHKYDEVMEMVDREVLDGLEESITRFFFLKASRGETFGEVNRIKETYGSAPEENYPYASPSFLKFARTYWTYKIELTDIMVSHQGILVTVILVEIERNIGSVFFPHPGPAVTWVRQRRETQRQLLETYAPEIDIKSFLNGNPLLGTSGEPIAQEVFNERVWASCLNSTCHKFFQIPNTVKALRVTCPFCKKTFRFPAKDYSWLNSIPPYLHFDGEKARKLEKLRLRFNISHEMFTLGIMQTKWLTCRLQIFMLEKIRINYPYATERELWKMVLKSRIETPEIIGLPKRKLTEGQIDDLIQGMESFDELCDYIDSLDRVIPPLGITEEMESILSS